MSARQRSIHTYGAAAAIKSLPREKRKKERDSPSTWKAAERDEGDVSKPGEKQSENERTRERTDKEGMTPVKVERVKDGGAHP